MTAATVEGEKPDRGEGDCEPPIDLDTTYSPDHRLCDQSGSLEDWLSGLETLLIGQDVLTFAAVAGLTAPLLCWSPITGFSIEFVGRPATGKTTACALAAASWGRPALHDAIVPFERLSYPSFVSESLAMFADHPLVVDGADELFATHTTRERQGYLRDVDRAISGMSVLDGPAAATRRRHVVISSSQRSITELSGDLEEGCIRLGGHLLTVKIPDRSHGVVATVPAPFASAGRYINALSSHMQQHHGWAGRQFLAGVLNAINRDALAFRNKVAGMMEEFVSHAAVDENNGPLLRDAWRFGLVFAADRLAKAYEAMPPNLDTDNAILGCWRLYTDGEAGTPFLARLHAIADEPNIIDLGGGKLPTIDKPDRKQAAAYLRTKGGARYLYIPADKIGQAFADWDRIKSSDEVERLLQFEYEYNKDKCRKRRKRKVKKRLSKGEAQESVYCFLLNPSV